MLALLLQAAFANPLVAQDIPYPQERDSWVADTAVEKLASEHAT